MAGIFGRVVVGRRIQGRGLGAALVRHAMELSIVEIYQAGEHGLERLNTVIQRFREILGGGGARV